MDKLDIINQYNINQTEASKAPSAAEQSHRKKIAKAAGDFESLFTYQLLKEMRKNELKSDLFGDRKTEEIYTSMLDQELADVISKGEGMGLKEALIRELGGDTPLGRITEARDSSFMGELSKQSAIREFQSHIEDNEVFREPVNGRVSSGYGLRTDPIDGKRRFHSGTDIAAAEGTPIHPAMSGTVTFSGERGGYGNVVEIKHDNGYISLYGHNKENLVKVGDRVTQSDVIAHVGSTGRATGAHVHFEMKLEGFAVNPVEVLDFG